MEVKLRAHWPPHGIGGCSKRVLHVFKEKRMEEKVLGKRTGRRCGWWSQWAHFNPNTTMASPGSYSCHGRAAAMAWCPSVAWWAIYLSEMQTLLGNVLSQDHSLYIPWAVWKIHIHCLDLASSVWTSLPHSVQCLCFFHADDQKLWLGITLASASWKLTMFRQLIPWWPNVGIKWWPSTWFLHLLCRISPATISPSQLISTAAEGHFWSPRLAEYVGPGWETKVDALGLLVVISCAEYGAF